MKILRFLLKAFAALLVLAVVYLTYEYLSLPDVARLKHSNPRTTALMEVRAEQYRRKGLKPVRRQIWMPYDRFPDHLKRAVLLAEDAAFFSHQGVDLFELKEAIKQDLEQGRFKRGASTITMQLARNLYLSPEKSLLRKGREIMIAYELERVLSKRRIFELYLNVVEWGPGVYGAEMAARHYFGKSAADLTVPEAATLAALLPSPLAYREKSLLRRRNLVLRRMMRVGYIDSSQYEAMKEAPLFARAAG
ncbi:MAG TPA: monofunctional biosynthetic peptidoglycan transglycosylase [Candidatus Acidoferrales bacterium]|nr:monofunctional biosynthetic peptidoglycan transglycosylase [Candidatus Acidoferrales bacterium]